MKTLATVLLSAVCFADAMPAAENSRLVIRAVGQFETASTVVYSIFLASREEPLGGLLIRSTLPAGARFLENVEIPATARYEGVADGVIQWSVPALDRDTLLGPFTFRVIVQPHPHPRQRIPLQTVTPVAPAFSVSYRLPAPELLEDHGVATRLLPLAESGSITFDQQGTLDANRRNGLVAVGDTGILIYAPAGAVDRPVTLTFRRLPVDDDKVPQGARDTWWCGLYQAAIQPRVDFAKPVTYALPTRRPLTAGLTVRAFSSADLTDWREVTAGSAGAAVPKQFGFGGTGCTTVPFGFTTCSSNAFGFGGGFGGGFGAFGVNQNDRLQSSITGTALSQQFGQPFRPAQISDGTSNIIAILIGIR